MLASGLSSGSSNLQSLQALSYVPDYIFRDLLQVVIMDVVLALRLSPCSGNLRSYITSCIATNVAFVSTNTVMSADIMVVSRN